jgi:hypothetical protein
VRVAERRRILEAIASGQPVLNVEARLAGRSLLLPLDSRPP